MNIEELLPKESRLEYAASELKDVLDEQLVSRMEAQLGSVVDLNDESIRWIEHSPLATREFGFYYLGVDFEDEPTARDVVVRSAQFALQVARDLGESDPKIDLYGYLADLNRPETEPLEELLNETQTYLSTRESLDYLINFYAMDLDESYSYPHIAETICAMIFMLHERAVAEERLQTSIDNLSPEDFTL